jgi:hypothetical protein
MLTIIETHTAGIHGKKFTSVGPRMLREEENSEIKFSLSTSTDQVPVRISLQI